LVDNLSLSFKLIVMYCDNQSIIHLVKNWIYHERTKHIDVKYHFILNIVSQGVISMKKIVIV
jgi:hypothetical protein